MNEPVSPVVNLLGGLVMLGSLFAWVAIGLTLRERRAPIEFCPRRPVPWRGSDVLLLAVAFLGFEFLAAGGARAIAGEDDRTAILWMLVLQSVARVLWFGFSVAHLKLRGAGASDLGWDMRFVTKDMVSGVWLFLAAVVPVLLVQLFFTKYLEIPSEHPLIQLTQDGASLTLMIGATIAAVGIAPWFEEFVFRVILQGWLEGEQVRLRKDREPERSDSETSDRPGYAPLVVASLVFAGMHFSAGPDPVAIFVLSLFLGYAYRQTHRILSSLVIHAGINGWTMLNLWIMYFTGEKL